MGDFVQNIQVDCKPNQEIFSDVLQRFAAEDKNIVVVTSDSRGSGKLVSFGQKFPKQIIEVGIAEQNLVGVAAGLSSCDKKVFAVSPACFLTARSLEQIKNDVCYSDHPVVLVGISAGVSYGALGSTHHSLHDLAALRAIHNISIIVPADNFETEEAVKYASKAPKPVYLRFGKKQMPLLSSEKTCTEFVVGKGRVIKTGKDVAIIANGETVLPALKAAEKLMASGIDATVVSMHTIKPLDTDLLDELANRCSALLTIEEHSVHGGLGEACASWLLQNGFRKPFKIMGIPDEYTITGSQLEIFGHYGISEEGIIREVLQLIKL